MFILLGGEQVIHKISVMHMLSKCTHAEGFEAVCWHSARAFVHIIFDKISPEGLQAKLLGLFYKYRSVKISHGVSTLSSADSTRARNKG